MGRGLMNDGILHEKDDQKYWIPREGGRLVSLLDILGGGNQTCDVCGRWQSFSALTPRDAREQLAESGWQSQDGKDVCPKCAAASAAPQDAPR